MIDRFKRTKYVQLALTALAGTAFFIVLIVVPGFRTRVFTDMPLLFLCAIMWALMVMTTIFILIDLERLIHWETEH